MATDNTTLNPGGNGDTIRDILKGSAKTQVVILDLGGAGAESLLTGTLPVSAASLPLPTLAATSTNQTTEIASLASIDGKITACNTGAVVISSGVITSITNSVAVTGAFFQTTQPISAATLPLPTNAATSALQTTGNTSLSSIDGKITACNTGAVVISSGNVAVTGSVTANAGTNLNTSLLALESGGNLASIAGKDFATQTTLALIKAKTDNLDAASSTLATAALQTTGNTSLSTIATNTPTVGQKAMAGSSPVVVASDQTAIPVTVSSIVPGTSATSLGKAEDAAAADGDTGVAALAVRQDAPGYTTGVGVGATGDYSWLTVDAQGRLWVNSDVLANIMQAQNTMTANLLSEMKLLRQSFQDWSGQTDPRYDAQNNYIPNNLQ